MWVDALKPVWSKFEGDVGKDLIDAAQTSRNSVAASASRFATAGLVCALAVAAFAAPFASGLPDGLDSVVERFRIAESDQSVSGLFADYDAIPMAGWQGLSVSVAGIGGALVVFAAAIVGVVIGIDTVVRFRSAIAFRLC